MSALADFQRRMMTGILRGPAQGGMAVHLDTVFGALANALRLTFPTVAQLLDQERFRELAHEYVRAHPPRAAVLYSYGGEFPAYIQRSTAGRALPFLHDVASFDLRIDQVAHCANQSFTGCIAIDPQLDIQLPRSLTCLQTKYPVDLIRDSLGAGGYEAFESIDMTQRVRHFAIWRVESGAGVKCLHSGAAIFLNTLLEGGRAEDGLQRAAEVVPLTEVVGAIRSELLNASFVRLIWHDPRVS